MSRKSLTRSERSRRPDGGWNELQTLLLARYSMHGWAIHDQNFKGRFTATNLRFYDPDLGAWRVSWFRTGPTANRPDGSAA